MAFSRTMIMAGLRAGLVAVCTFAAAASAKAQQPAIGSPPPPPLPPARVIVGGEGSVTVPPDYAEITSGVTTQAKTAKQATDANAQAMTAVTAALQSDGIAANDIQTLRFSVSPVYGSPPPNSAPRLTGFSVSNQLDIKVRQIDKVGAVLDSLIAAGATDAGSVRFLHSDASKTLDQARQAAIADARRKADLYAQASGLKLGGVAWITEEPAYAPPTPMGARVFAPAMSTPIAPGEDTLRISITVGFTAAP